MQCSIMYHGVSWCVMVCYGGLWCVWWTTLAISADSVRCQPNQTTIGQ